MGALWCLKRGTKGAPGWTSLRSLLADSSFHTWASGFTPQGEGGGCKLEVDMVALLRAAIPITSASSPTTKGSAKASGSGSAAGRHMTEAIAAATRTTANFLRAIDSFVRFIQRQQQRAVRTEALERELEAISAEEPQLQEAYDQVRTAFASPCQ